MLYTFILTVIMMASPDGGRTVPVEEDKYITVELPPGHSEDYISPTECQKYAGIEVNKWLIEHPGYRVVKWRCPPPKKKEQDI